ncbi:MAG: hypothetical protein PHC70_04210 [Patescibacteria group bacterium]|nr:hypothetical protein [Patescibacteria group bacterium]
MKGKSVSRRIKPAPKEKPTSDTAWAVVTMASFPIVALSLAAMGWKSYTAFIMACLATLAILLIEAIVRGRVWIFQKQYQHIFDHQETPFRILVVTGGVLLVLETILLIQFFQNPAIDGYILNLVARKQCYSSQAPFAHLICPMFERASVSKQAYALDYSMEQAAKSHLMPTALAGSCMVVPVSQSNGAATCAAKFFAYCQAWQADSCQHSNPGEVAMVTAQFTKNSEGFYVPTAWQEDRQSEEYQKIMGNKDLLQYLEKKLYDRCVSEFR